MIINMMNDYDSDYNDFRSDGFRDSDEDTEDASETESMKVGEEYPYSGIIDDFESNYDIKEQIYRDKLAQLKDQLAQLEARCHPEYLIGLEKLQQSCEERCFRIESLREIEKNRIENDFRMEMESSIKEFNDRRDELKVSLLTDLEEKRKIIEVDSTLELTFDATDPKPLPTRKLRRRPNDPIPMPDRRRRASPAQINFLLDENDITDDLKTINKILTTNSKSSGKSANSLNSKNTDGDNFLQTEARIEDGKLFYDKKWFHRGQNIYLESSSDGIKANAMILQIGTNEIWVRKTNESIKSKVSLSDLQTKKFTIQRRS